MNKKKKTARLKHRKNKERMKKLLQTSLLKAKPKKVFSSSTVDTSIETEVKAVKKVSNEKPAAETTTPKQTPKKKTAAKKTTTKKTAAKKTTTKKD